MKNKCEFFKRIYKDYVIIFDYNGVKKTMGFNVTKIYKKW